MAVCESRINAYTLKFLQKRYNSIKREHNINIKVTSTGINGENKTSENKEYDIYKNDKRPYCIMAYWQHVTYHSEYQLTLFT